VLRINVTDSPHEQRWSLQGRLCGQWVVELWSTWMAVRNEGDHRKCLVDLNEVTFIDRSGEAALAEMMRQGAEFIASGMYTRHLLSILRSECQ
jgi:ABC-type transporter Mla MlaB component